MNPETLSPNFVESDSAQQEQGEWFAKAGVRLWDEQERRLVSVRSRKFYEHNNYCLVHRVLQQIQDLRGLFFDISHNISHISESSGTVAADNAELYLEQELQRARYLIDMHSWDERNSKDRLLMALLLGRKDEKELPEVQYYQEGHTRLSGSLSGLHPDENCRRACFVLAEIYKRQRHDLHDYVFSRMQHTRDVVVQASTCCATLLTQWFAYVAGAYAVITNAKPVKELVTRRYNQEVRVAMCHCKAVIAKHNQEYATIVNLSKAEAGLK